MEIRHQTSSAAPDESIYERELGGTTSLRLYRDQESDIADLETDQSTFIREAIDEKLEADT